MSSTSQQVLLAGAAAGGVVFPLDGVSGVTGAWSHGRRLLSSFNSTFYTDLGQASTYTLFNQQGTTLRDLTQTSTRNPVGSTAGPNSRPCGVFDGINDCLNGQSAATVTNLFTTTDGMLIISCIIDSITLNDATIYLNHRLFTDSLADCGIMLKTASGNTVAGYNWDGNADAAPITGISTATPYVFCWKHTGGNVSISVNGGSFTSTASGAHVNGAAILSLGGLNSGTGAFAGKIFECVTLTPALADPSAIISDFKTYCGA